MDDAPELQNQQLNRLRAAVLGANDGIVSTSSIMMGVIGAGAEQKAIFTAGMAAIVAGALSMAVGEYVSVSSQSDAEKVHIEKANGGDMKAHEITSPWQAAVASLVSFTIGGLVPFVSVLLTPRNAAVPVAFGAVFCALILTGYTSATVGGASRKRAVIRVVIGGLLAMAITYFVGRAFGAVIS